jgi:hypothetical protein
MMMTMTTMSQSTVLKTNAATVIGVSVGVGDAVGTGVGVGVTVTEDVTTAAVD